MVPFFISNRFRPGCTWSLFFSNRLYNFAFFFVHGLTRASPILNGQKLWNTAVGWGFNQSHAIIAMFTSRSRHVTEAVSVVRAFFVTKWSVNKVNTGSNISNRSTVLVLPMYICNLPILCKHEQLSAIVEWTQSDHLDCRHWMEGVSTTKSGTESFFSTFNRSEKQLTR